MPLCIDIQDAKLVPYRSRTQTLTPKCTRRHYIEPSKYLDKGFAVNLILLLYEGPLGPRVHYSDY